MESVMAEKPVNMGALCRLCLSQRIDSLKSIFDETLGPNRVPQKIHQLIQIQVNKNDRVSTMVCNDCIIRLDTWFAYKRQCHRNQAKLVEWLHKTTGESMLHLQVQIKSEPLDEADTSRHGSLPFKMEYAPIFGDMMDEEFNDLPQTLPAYPQNNDHLYLEDLQTQEQDETSAKCFDCGKVFGNANNRRRHQNMAHRKDRRSQMMEIKKPDPPPQPQGDQDSEKAAEGSLEPETDNSIEQNSTSASENIESSGQTTDNTEDTSTTSKMDTISSDMHTTSSEMHTTSSEMHTTSSEMHTTSSEMTANAEESQEDSTVSPDKMATEDKTQEESSTETTQEKLAENTDLQDNQDTNLEDNQENQDNTNEAVKTSEENQTEENPSDESEDKQNENPPESEDNQQKIEFAAGLKLVQKDSTPGIEFEPLSKIELSYIEKCKAMVSMFHTLQCACHNVQHKSLRHLLSHLREMRIWFPLFTCYSCMISFTDRSTFTRHYSKCPRSQLETLIKLSNLRKRSEIKIRLYQNYKCNRCKFLYTFHDDFCKHINEDHAAGSPPFYCSCRFVFDSLEEYKSHCYTSCILSYYCDICFITTSTMEEFLTHSQETHDASEGFMLLQEDSYTPRNNVVFRSREVSEDSVIEGKRERKKSVKEPIIIQTYEKIPPDLKDIPTKVVRKMVLQDYQPINANVWNRQPASCPVCKKQYSSLNNMVRHYRSHIERKEIELPSFEQHETGDSNEDLYSCPDCGGVYAESEWKNHIEEVHQPINCNECDKVFQFQSELDNHRSVHLNLKVYRDSKTHSLKTALLSPTADSNELDDDVMVMCEVCDEIFKSKEELKIHKFTQHDISALSRASSSMENLELPTEDPMIETTMEVEEENTESPNEPGASNSMLNYQGIPCDTCGKIYANHKTLKEHAQNRHGIEYIKKSEFPKKCDYCDKICSTGAGLFLHTQIHERYKSDNKSEFPKQCEYCDKICTTGAGLYLHTQMHERISLGDLNVETMLPIKTEPINIESIKTERDRSGDEDEEEEDESYHTCKRCFKVFATKGKLREHMKCHGINPSKPAKKNRKILCDLCHVAVDNIEALELHKVEEHNDELDGMPTLHKEMEVDEQDVPLVYTCDICVETFDSKLELKQHKETHVNPTVPKPQKKLVYCKYCKIAFDSINTLTKHMHLEHGESAKPKITKVKLEQLDDSDKPFKCSICSKGFASHGAMTAHFGWHKRSSNNREYREKLENTPKGTANAKMAKKAKVLKKIAEAAVNKQEPIHMPEFQCTTCFLELPNDTALQIHILEAHQNLDSMMLIPRCDTCNKDFVTQEEYDTHKRFHVLLDRKKKYEQLQAQQQPQQIQTPIIQSVQSVAETPPNSPKRFPCNWCSSVFSRNDSLNAHIKQHHKEHVQTEFACNQCDRVFDKQNYLTIHLKVHEKQKSAAIATVVSNGGSVGGKVYACSICNQGFSFPKDLRMHTITAHPF